MVGAGMFDGLNQIFNLAIIVFILLFIIVCYAVIDWLFLDEVIRSSSHLIPELEITVKNNVIDTLYVYRKP